MSMYACKQVSEQVSKQNSYFNSVQQGTILWTDKSRSGVRRVHVKPDIVLETFVYEHDFEFSRSVSLCANQHTSNPSQFSDVLFWKARKIAGKLAVLLVLIEIGLGLFIICVTWLCVWVSASPCVYSQGCICQIFTGVVRVSTGD